MGNVEYQNPNAVAAENHKNCLYMAMASGVLATLPIILKVRQVMKMNRYIARRKAVAAERKVLAERLAALKKTLPKELGPKPKFLRLAEEAYEDAQRSHMKAFMNWARINKSAAPGEANYLGQEAEKVKQTMHDANQAWETLVAARIEAKSMGEAAAAGASDLKSTVPDLAQTISQEAKTLYEIDKTIPDFEKEFDTEVLEMGFGGVLSGK